MSKIKNLKELESIAVFLIFELLALTTFGLGAINIVFHVAGFLVAVFSLLTSSGNFKKEELTGLLPLIIPLVIFAGIVSFGTADYYKGATANNIFSFLGIISFFLMGLAARRSESFNMKTALLCIGGGLALLVVINTIATWIDYGPFYPLIYAKTPDGYYRGQVIDLTSEMNVLFGFKFYESTILYGSQYSVLLACSIPALFFIDRKKNLKEFLIVASFGVIALISILTITNLTAIIFAILAVVIGVLYKFFRENELFKKLGKWALIVIVGIVAIVVLLVIINCAGNNALSRAIAGNSFLNKVFNTNEFMQKVNAVLVPALKPFNFFGFDRTNVNDKDLSTIIGWSTNSTHFELEVIKEGGIFALLMLIIFGVFSFFSFVRYFRNSKDEHTCKVIILSAVVVFFFFMSFNYNAFPLIHNDGYFNSFSRGFLFLIILFLCGYVASGFKVQPIEFERKVVEKNNVLEKTVVDDYDFSDSDEGVKHE